MRINKPILNELTFINEVWDHIFRTGSWEANTHSLANWVPVKVADHPGGIALQEVLRKSNRSEWST